MTSLRAFVRALDLIHRAHPIQVKRDLRGNLFGVRVPAWIIFHAVLGYVILAIGLAAIVIRFPWKPFRRRRWLHPYLGYGWIFGTVWMPVTAIWCVYAFTGWDFVAFFIFSMYATIQFGWLCIRWYRKRLLKSNCNLGREVAETSAWKTKVWKWLHAFLMIYSFSMLLGAGISFPFRAIQDYTSE